ncbi:response regulator transcription factor [Oceanispirochaeta sp.]|jgi:DNA-binding NarL/FixJ family response regulator|uniref:response regulator transcription factor n=1 Tax=Oceanispirochaeta sp. TaxID=2035350 RepID=UPI0026298B69|nr:response regulator transcription factor [Oceanispirochaeta sp.]MDA3956269.1 response regulator transcription factor [Oceanispirochaeta sp.]
MTKKFIIVDDHPIFRHGLVTLIQTDENYHVSAEASSIEEVFELLKTSSPDIIIVDITLNNQNGLDLVQKLQPHEPKIPILVVSMHDEEVYAERSIQSGALGYVMKHSPPEVIMEAIGTVLKGKIYLSESIQKKIVEARFSQPQGGRTPMIESLSQREMEILQYIGQGFGASEIAGILTLSVKTIHTYRDHLKQKLQIDSSQELRKFAIKWNQSMITNPGSR